MNRSLHILKFYRLADGAYCCIRENILLHKKKYTIGFSHVAINISLSILIEILSSVCEITADLLCYVMSCSYVTFCIYSICYVMIPDCKVIIRWITYMFL